MYLCIERAAAKSTEGASLGGLATEGGPSGAEQIQQWLPGARVVKAFNTVFAALQAEPVVEGRPVDGLVAGDDDYSARETVLKQLAEMVFRPIDVGTPARAPGPRGPSLTSASCCR